MRKRKPGLSARPRRRGAAVLFIAVACILVLMIWIDSAIRPAVESVISYQAKVFATRIINDAMLTQMEQDVISYGELVKIVRDENGEVKSIEADMVAINRLKSNMSDTIIARLEQSENRKISIPVGTVIGNQFTSGRGPLVEIKVLPTGYVQSEIYNQFVSAGINQTSHQIMLKINVQMIAVLPGYSVKTDTVTNFCIAETIVVGKIPQGYAVLGDVPAYKEIRLENGGE